MPQLYSHVSSTHSYATLTLSKIICAFPEICVYDDISHDRIQSALFLTPFLVDAEGVEESLQLELIEMLCDIETSTSLPTRKGQVSYDETTHKKNVQSVRLKHMWRNIFSVKSEQKQIENQNALRISTTQLIPDLHMLFS